ncbi:MAG: hypothetical protein FWH37_09130 [Candidatus Bathyarchaeota archaeon]|nr:hypothetical protein [Candidatus Termiticorpusculum sp.]
MRLQGTKNKINKQLVESNLTPEKRQSLEDKLTHTTRRHTAKWDEVIGSPDKDRIIDKIEQAQIKQLKKEKPANAHATMNTNAHTKALTWNLILKPILKTCKFKC